MINDIFPLLPTNDLDASLAFYRDALELSPVFETDWYVQLQGPDEPKAQLGLITGAHETIPERFHANPAGVVITIEVDDADAAWDRARQAGAEIAQALRSEPFGQRHFMTVDPGGLLIDVVQEIEPDPEWLRAQGLT